MDRRDFLRTLGLGGLALTLPKPLEVVAARMADLKTPPIHAGLARFRDLRGVMVRDFSLSLNPCRTVPDRNHVMDFMETWSVHLAAHEKGHEYVPILQGIAVKYLKTSLSDGSHALEFQSHLPDKLLAGTMLDIYIVPEGRPRFPLPQLVATLHGEAACRGDGTFSNGDVPIVMTGRIVDLSVQVRSVRLERTRAIELGLVSPSDPFETL